MSDSSTEEVISLVYSMFKVIKFNKENYSLEFQIEDRDFNSKFEELARKLEDLSYLGKLEKMDNENYIIIQKLSPWKKRKWLSSSWTPRILFTVVVAFVMYDGFNRTNWVNAIPGIDIGKPEEMAIITLYRYWEFLVFMN